MRTIGSSDISTSLSGMGRRLRVACSPAARIYRFLQESQWYSAEQFRAYQFSELHQVIRRAYETVPYYRTLMEVYGLHPEQLRSLDDIRRLPMLTAEEIRKHHQELLSDDLLWSFSEPAMNQVSGVPVPFHYDLYNLGFEAALMRRQYRWAGLGRWDRIATLKSERITASQLRKGIFWHFSLAENRLRMSAHHLSVNNAGRYIRALRYYQPRALDGYPSVLYVLSKVMLQKNIRFAMAAVLTSSETLLPAQRSVIQKAFSSPVFDYYDMKERAAAIHTCEYGRYHIIPEYSLVELITNDETKGDYVEIVGTSLTNRAMPMIRYRAGDLVKMSRKSCPCGRCMPVVEHIVGHGNDYVVTPSGKLIGRLDRIFREAPNLRDVQIYQPDREHLVLRIVPDRYFKDYDGTAILEKLKKVLGEEIRVEIERRSSIPATNGGKHKTVISDVNAYTEL